MHSLSVGMITWHGYFLGILDTRPRANRDPRGSVGGIDIRPANCSNSEPYSPSAIAGTLGNEAARLYEASTQGVVQPLAAGAANNNAISPLLTIGDRVLVEAFPLNQQGNALENLRKIGFEQIASYQGAASGWLPIRNLDKLATTAGFSQLRPVYQPVLKAGSVLSEGDQALRADLSRLNFDVDGTGITVGILSDSFDSQGGAAAGIASGDLPAEGVRVLQDLPRNSFFFGSDEGRAMAEIVHDIAPGASILFATAFLGQISFANNIIALVQAGADVIVDDVRYFNAPFFQDGIVAQAAQFAVASGVSFFSAAGNSADEAVDGNFLKSGVKDPDDAGNLHAFRRKRNADDEPDTLQKITVPDGGVAQIILQWDSPFASAGFFGASSDLAIYIMGADGTTVIAKEDVAYKGAAATEIITFENDGSHDLDGEAGPDETFNVAISLKKGNVSQFKYLYRGTITINEYNTRGSTVFGHSNARDVIAVAAAPYFATPEFGSSSTILESFSSLGGTEILFDSFGFNTSTGVRLQPTLTGIDGTDNTFFGRFFGTSAAAPHLAAVAALMLDSAGGPDSLSPSQVRSTMIDAATDVTLRSGPRGTPIRVPTPDPPVGRGYDFYSGYGLVDANLAVGSVKKYAAVAGIAFSDDNGNGVRDVGEAGLPNIAVYLDRNNDGLLGYGEPAALTDATGSYRFSDLDAGTYSIRQVITPGYELVAPLGTVLVTVTLGQFPHVDLANRPKFDYGDAPAPYATSLAANGPRHGIQPGLYLGSSADSDTGSAVTGSGDFDDLNGVDDEDGVTFVTDLVRGSNTAVEIRATIGSNSPAVLQAWVDFDRDGRFDTPGEKVLQNQLLAEGINRLTILSPSWAVVGPTYARFRYGYERDLGPLGPSRAGEVEDYRVLVSNSSGSGIGNYRRRR
ncbi:MAG: GEVED domain-containing protein [Planctomycetota bacterium]|nr:GEVED domain-containing protein [Planctomycetota bacterium]